MSDDWKKKIQDHFARKNQRQQTAKQHAESEEEDVRLIAEKQARCKADKLEAENMAKLQNSFKCHVCGVPSSKPGEKILVFHDWDSDMHCGHTSSSIAVDWTIPGDLVKCSMGDHWVHEEHVFMGICQKCAEKLP